MLLLTVVLDCRYTNSLTFKTHSKVFLLLSLLVSLIIAHLSILMCFDLQPLIPCVLLQLIKPMLGIPVILWIPASDCDGAWYFLRNVCRLVHMRRMQNIKSVKRSVPTAIKTIRTIFKFSWHVDPVYQAKHSHTTCSEAYGRSDFLTTHLPW